MKVTFLTRREDHITDDPLITTLRPENYNLHQHLLRGGKCKIKHPISYSDWFVIGHDIETRGYPESGGELLLSAFCVKDEEVLVIDNTSVRNSEVFDEQTLKYCFFIAHNADFEARWGVVSNFLPGRYGCTMVNGKRLLSGQDGYHFDLISEINRHLGYKKIPIWMDKDIRNEFSTIQYFEPKHILYNAADAIRLAELYFKQLEQASALNQLFLHNSINSRVIIPIAKAEVYGIKHDSDKWAGIARERREKAERLCQELTQIVIGQYGVNLEKVNPAIRKQRESWEKRQSKISERKLKLQLQIQSLEEKRKQHLKSYRVSQEQLLKLETTTPEQVKKDTGVINWGSPKQVLEVFRQIGIPLPESRDKKTRKMKPGVGKEARTTWFVNNTDSTFLPTMEIFDKFKKTEHNIKAFGDNWIAQYVRNCRAYTMLDQAGTTTGRFSSGDKGRKNKRYMNGQQIPSKGEDKIYRECFIADEGRSMGTLDYSNCEGAVMSSLAGDLNMLKVLKIPDSHSYLGTKCWKNIYAHRYTQTKDPQWLELSTTYEMNQTSLEKKKERDIFKNSGGLFPVAYGVQPGKVAATSKITEAEAKVMIDTIKAEIPDVIKFLDHKSKVALTEGYTIHNSRTGSIRWFSAILDKIKYGFKPNKSDLAEIEFASRNTAVQGEVVP